MLRDRGPGRGAGDGQALVVKSKNLGGSGRLRGVRMVFCPGVVAERCATWPSLVARVTRCIRSSS